MQLLKEGLTVFLGLLHPLQLDLQLGNLARTLGMLLRLQLQTDPCMRQLGLGSPSLACQLCMSCRGLVQLLPSSLSLHLSSQAVGHALQHTAQTLSPVPG